MDHTLFWLEYNLFVINSLFSSRNSSVYDYTLNNKKEIK